MSLIEDSASRSLVSILCAAALWSSVFAMPALAMDQAQKGADGDDSNVVVAMGALGAGGDRDRDPQRPPSTVPRYALAITGAYAGLATLCLIGIAAAWPAEHFTHDCPENNISNPGTDQNLTQYCIENIGHFCRQCLSACLQ